MTPTVELTVEQRVAIARGARAEKMRRSLAEFFKNGWGQAIADEQGVELEWAHHLDVICDHVQGQLMDWKRARHDKKFKVRAQDARYHFPPGTLKSRLISVYAPAWMWLHEPSWTALCLSANDDVAKRDAVYSRDLITSAWYRETFEIDWQIRGDIDARGKYQNTAGGWRMSRMLVSKITGGRADAIIIDDPNDAHEVWSESIRRDTNGKFDNAIYNRVNDPRISLRMLMQQHVHSDDLGYHWSRKGKQMAVVMPMEFDPEVDDVTPYAPEGYEVRTEKGEPLQPERFTPEFLASERERLGEFGYEAQYNQNCDVIVGGWMSRKDFRFFRMPGQREGTRPRDCNTEPAVELAYREVTQIGQRQNQLDLDWITISVDATFGSLDLETASQVGLLVIGGRGAHRFILDDRTKVMTFPQTCDALAKFEVGADGKEKLVGGLCFDWPQATRVLVEKKANGAAVLQTLGAKIPGFIPYVTADGKHPRARAMMPAVEAGNVFVREGMKWTDDVITELCSFPNGRWDDRVDALSQLMAYASTTMDAVARWSAMAGRAAPAS